MEFIIVTIILFSLFTGTANGFAIKKGFGAATSTPTTGGGNDKCPCGSELNYDSCCKTLHNGDCSGTSPEKITRARYSAFVKGVPGFLIDTAHPQHKDYVRFTAATLEPRKARKAWEKEIVTKNTDVFEFLRLKIVNSTLTTDVVGESSVCFQILVRKKSDGTYIPFQETSYYVQASAVPETSRVLTLKGNQLTGLEWLYLHAEVTEIEAEEARRMVEEAPRYVAGASIRDRWEGKSSREIL